MFCRNFSQRKWYQLSLSVVDLIPMRVDDWEMSELIVMAASRFWAPLFFLTFASSLKPKWSTGSLGSSRSNCTKHLAMFREFSRTKSWNICFSFHQPTKIIVNVDVDVDIFITFEVNANTFCGFKSVFYT